MILKRLPIAIDAKAVSDDGRISGYASVFNMVDDGKDIVLPGAFHKSLSLRPAHRVKMLWQHRPDEPIGVWDLLSEDGRGLKAEGRLDMEVQRGREARSLFKSGAIDGLSIGFITEVSDVDRKTGVRKLKQLDLHEISVVTFPMNPEARASAKENVGAFDGTKNFNPRELEKGLRDAGLSRSDAVKAVAFFKDSLRDAGEDEADQLASRFRALRA